MNKSKVTGKVAAISDYRDKDYFNLALDDADQDDNWFIGDGTLRDHGNHEKGDKVTLEVEDGRINDVEVVEATEDGATRETDQRTSSSDSGRGKGSNAGKSQPLLTSKDRQIMVIAASKQAKDIMLHEEDNMDEELTQGEKLEVMGEYTNGIYNMMKAQIKDKTGGDA